ncbi:MAG: AtpZ/AtpI family protein [Thermodesulfobacteriota bacterium]
MADNKEGGPLRGLYVLATMGVQLAVSTFVGLFIGYYLDRFFGSSPWLTIIFLILGTAAGFKNMFTTARKYGK